MQTTWSSGVGDADSFRIQMQQPSGENVTLADTGRISPTHLPETLLITIHSAKFLAGLDLGFASTSGRGWILDPFRECLRNLSDLC